MGNLYIDAAKEMYRATEDRRLKAMEGMTDEQKDQYDVDMKTKFLSIAKSDPVFNQEGEISFRTKLRILGLKRQLDDVPGDTVWINETKARLKKAYRLAELEKQGVITDRPLPAGNIELGFGDRKLYALRKALKKHFGKQTRVFRSEEDIIYIDPNSNELVKVNPDWQGNVGLSIPVATEVTGAVGTYALTKKLSVPKQVVAETGFGGVMAALGEYIRLAIGKGMDAHDMTPEEMYEAAGIAGAWSATLTGAIGTLFSSAKAIKNFWEGRIFTRQDALDAGVKAEEADDAVNVVNDMLGGEKFRLTYAQRADDPIVESAEAELRQESDYARQFREVDQQNLDAQKDALEYIGRPELKPYAPGDVREVAREAIEREVAPKQAALEASEKQLKSELDTISKTKQYGVGEDVGSVLKEKSEAAYDAQKKVWTDIEDDFGYDPVKEVYNIPIKRGKEAERLHAIYKRQANTATTTDGAPPSKGMFNDASEELEDLADYNKEISRLKTKLRDAKRGSNPHGLNIFDLQRTIKALEKDRKVTLIKAGKEDLLERIEAAENATKKYYNTYKKSVIGDLTAVNDKGVPIIKSRDYVKNMMNRSVEEMDDFMAIISDNPELMRQWKEGVGDWYKSKVFPVGKEGVESYSHRMNVEIISEYKPMLKSAGFSEKEISGFLKTGKLHEKVAKATKALKDFVSNMNTKYREGKLVNTDPNNLIKFITEDTGGWITRAGEPVQHNLSKIADVKKLLKNYPGAWQALQNDYKKTLRDAVTDFKTGGIDPNKLNTIVSDSGNRKTIVAMMGEQYLEDLVKINRVMQMVSKKLTRLQEKEVRGILIQLVRGTAAPPMGKKGRLFTAALLFAGKKGRDATLKALLDPASMREIAKLAEHNAVTRAFAEKAVSLGYGE